jgi:hypothetical protein
VNREFLRRVLLRTSDGAQLVVTKLRGAADRLAPNRRLTLADCEASGWQNVRPCFVLSTGRSGTLFLNRLLLRSPSAYAVHQPRPELIRASRRAYEEIARTPDLFAETFKSAREELVHQAAQRGKVFIETNNRITFFAPVMRSVFPRAVFIHLVRHPGDVVRSGIRRGWYSGRHSHDPGRIVPLAGEMQGRWANLNQVEKIGWLWNETNRFVEEFRSTLSTGDCLLVRAEELFTDVQVAQRIFEFVQVQPVQVREGFLRQAVNVQRKGKYPHFTDWPTEEKERLARVAPLMARYGYAAD